MKVGILVASELALNQPIMVRVNTANGPTDTYSLLIESEKQKGQRPLTIVAAHAHGPLKNTITLAPTAAGGVCLSRATLADATPPPPHTRADPDSEDARAAGGDLQPSGPMRFRPIAPRLTVATGKGGVNLFPVRTLPVFARGSWRAPHTHPVKNLSLQRPASFCAPRPATPVSSSLVHLSSTSRKSTSLSTSWNSSSGSAVSSHLQRPIITVQEGPRAPEVEIKVTG